MAKFSLQFWLSVDRESYRMLGRVQIWEWIRGDVLSLPWTFYIGFRSWFASSMSRDLDSENKVLVCETLSVTMVP